MHWSATRSWAVGENREAIHSDRRVDRCLRASLVSELAHGRGEPRRAQCRRESCLSDPDQSRLHRDLLLPMVPGASAVIGGAFWAGLLASGGALAGMAVSDAILARIEPRNAAGPASAGPLEAGEKTRPRL
jgi:hypothetical protein